LEPVNSFSSLNALNGIGNITLGFILPEDNQDESIINKVMDNNIIPSFIQPVHFKNEKQMSDFNNDYYNILLAGIIFESSDYLHYTIRTNGTSTPDPNAEAITNYALGRYNIEEKAKTPYMGTDADKYLSIFSPIQVAVDQAIIRLKTNDDTFTFNPELGKFAKPSSEYNPGGSGGTLSTYLAMIFTMSIVLIVTNIVQEKEKRY